MDRRHFLKAGAALTTGLGLAACRLSLKGPAARGLVTTLSAAPLTYQLRPGFTVSGLGYNGRVPGPVFEVWEGAPVRVRFQNRTGALSTIHWHGLLLPNDMDGVPGVTQEPVPDGADFEYRFRAEPAGTRWYHSHVSPQLAQGLFGALVIRELGAPAVAHDLVAVLHDIPDWKSYAQALRNSSDAMPFVPSGVAGAMDMDGMAQGGGAMAGMSMGDEVRYVAHGLNGRGLPTRIAVAQDALVRLRLINASPTQTRYLRMAGHDLTVTHTDGNALPHPSAVDVLRLGPAERLDVLLRVLHPGAWMLAGLTRPSTFGEQSLIFYTPGFGGAAPHRPSPDLSGARVFSYRHAGGQGSAPLLPPGALAHTLVLGQRGRDWTIDQAVWPHTPKLKPRRGETVRLRFQNDTDMDHPMHLHGHLFALLALNDQWLQRPLMKDTALVPAHGSMVWQFAANEYSGRWLLHCHNEIHMMDGMTMEVDY